MATFKLTGKFPETKNEGVGINYRAMAFNLVKDLQQEHLLP